MSWCHDQCAEEAHRPVDCETVAKWVLKNSAESENMNWYNTYSGMNLVKVTFIEGSDIVEMFSLY